jgi:hypothetical protein
MPLPIRDGNQSLTTLSTILVSNAHIPAHTVTSLGTQAITDIATAVSGVELGPNTLNALENITVTLGQVTITGGLTDTQLRASAVTIGGTVTVGSIVTHGVTIANSSVTIGGSVTATISGTPSVTFTQASITFGTAVITGSASILNFPATQTVTFTQITTHGVTISNTSVTVNGTFYQATQPVSLATLPALVASTAQIGSVTASISGTPSITFGLISGTVTANPTGTQTIAGTVTVGNIVTIGSLPAISGTVTANLAQIAFINTQGGIASDDGGIEPNYGVQLGYYDGDYKIVKPSQPLPISGTVTANLAPQAKGPIVEQDSGIPSDPRYMAVVGGIWGGGEYRVIALDSGGQVAVGSLPSISGTVTANLGSSIPSGTNRIGVVTIGSGTVTLGASTAQIGSVTASFAISSSVITSGIFTSTTSATLVPANSARKMATVYNLGAGQLFINAGTTATTLGGGFMVALNASDFYECGYTTTTLSAIFATAGTASWISH